jgi:Tol biopolymer transport system component
LWAAPFDGKANRETANPVRIGSNVAVTANGIAQFAVSKNGNVAYLPEGPRSLVIVTREGKLHILTDEHRLYSNPRFSPDGERISVTITDEQGSDIWTVPVAGGQLTRATFARDARDAAWTPDGKFITWSSYRLGALGIYRSQPGVGTTPDSLFTAQPLANTGEWLKDGSGIVTVAANLARASGFDIAFVSKGGRGPIVPIIDDRFETRFPAVSPDGKWLAYVSNQSGRDEVYLKPWNSEGLVWRITARGATEPAWAPDGTTLFYRESSRQFLVAASLTLSPDRVLVPIRNGLFPIDAMIPGFTHRNFDISPDGQSFVMVFRSPGAGITVLKNVPQMLRGPAKR